jgi:putative flippase GtrA
MSERRTLRSRLEQLARELAKFGTVGAFGFLVNLIVFNLCVHVIGLAVVRSGVIATFIAICTNYLGNRYWTYRASDKSRRSRELTLFFLFSGVGLVIENGILAISHYGFGFTSTVADNVAKNVVGLGIATVFRFWSYRTWVFRALPAPGGSAGSAESFAGKSTLVPGSIRHRVNRPK